LPRRCTKTKGHVEGDTVFDGQLYAGDTVTFSISKQVRCDLGLKRDKIDRYTQKLKQIADGEAWHGCRSGFNGAMPFKAGNVITIVTSIVSRVFERYVLNRTSRPLQKDEIAYENSSSTDSGNRKT
jgi:hypothetical protein